MKPAILERQAALRDATQATRSYDFIRARALAVLVPNLPETQQQIVLRDALERSPEANAMGASVKVLFLDIDGVVNNKHTKENFKGLIMGIDPAMAALVQRIVRNTGCEVVLSSSWRLYQYSRDEVERKVCKFADITPILYAPRGYEIKAWLTLHPEIQHYAILDDSESILPEQ